MVSTDVPRRSGATLVEATVAMRASFEKRVRAAASWVEGVEDGLADLAVRIKDDVPTARFLVTDARMSGPELLALDDLERRRTLSSMRRGWEHHHPGEPVPELHLEFICGAIHHVLANALERGELDDLAERLTGVVRLTGALAPR